jgi:hypothetical protein
VVDGGQSVVDGRPKSVAVGGEGVHHAKGAAYGRLRVTD